MSSRCKLLILLTFTALRVSALTADQVALLNGVSEITAVGTPGPLVVFGSQAFVVVTGTAAPKSEPVVAAARYGSGRVVAFGHDGYLSSAALPFGGQTYRLLSNAVTWAAGTKLPPRVGSLESGPRTVLAAAGVTASLVSVATLSQVDVLAMTSAITDDATITAVRQFVLAGGGLIFAGAPGWGWRQLNPARDLSLDHTGNKLLAPAGIVWSDDYLSTTTSSGFSAGAPADLTQASLALDAAAGALTTSDRTQVMTVLTHAMRWIPITDTLLRPRLIAFAGSVSVVPTPLAPVGAANIAGRLNIAKYTGDLARDPSLGQTPHPAAATFPGSPVPGATPTTVSVTIPAGRDGWVSTGVYAPAGATITLTAPAGMANAGFALQIGAHTDELWGLDSWQRMPAITTSTPILGTTTQAASPFGGLIFVTLPWSGGTAAFTVTVAGGVPAPRFIQGTTDLATWQASIRSRPAPWAELEGRNVIVMVPSSAIRTLNDPASLLTQWDRAVELQDQLAGAPAPRTRQERILTDQQISAGYMHSGYPIMTGLDVVSDFVTLARMSSANSTSWGIFHEIGHNHQNPDWTFDGTTEVTVNIFTLYVYDKLLGVPVNVTSEVGTAARRNVILGWNFQSPSFTAWKADPFTALVMYAELIDAFGWDPFQRVFAEYLTLAAAQRPATDAAVRDQWLTRMSRTVGRDLGPFFAAWGIPVAQAARTSAAAYPYWMHPELGIPDPPCVVTLNPSSMDIASTGGSPTLTVTNSPVGCSWTPVGDSRWVTFIGSAQTGAQTLPITIYPNLTLQARTAKVTINGKVLTIAQAASTLSENERYIASLYVSAFGRYPSAAEIAGQLVRLGIVGRAALALEFLGAVEFNLAAKFVAGIYVGLLNRTPDYAGWVFQRNAVSTGFFAPQDLTRNFLQSPEFALNHPSQTRAQLVTLLYRQILGRSPDSAEVTGQEAEINRQVTQLGYSEINARTNMANSFLDSAEFRISANNKLYAFLLYALLLQRDPAAAEFENFRGRITDQNSLLPLITEQLAKPEFKATISQP